MRMQEGFPRNTTQYADSRGMRKLSRIPLGIACPRPSHTNTGVLLSAVRRVLKITAAALARTAGLSLRDIAGLSGVPDTHELD